MTTVNLTIDGRNVRAAAGRTILEAARESGAAIPTLCHMEGVKPYGACRLCLVELVRGDRVKYVASCVHEVAEGMVVRTDSPKLAKMRRLIAELLYPAVQGLPDGLRVTSSRFASEETNCTLCGRCVRHCAEVQKRDKVFFRGRGIRRDIDFSECLKSDCPEFQTCTTTCGSGRIVTSMVDYWDGK